MLEGEIVNITSRIVQQQQQQQMSKNNLNQINSFSRGKATTKIIVKNWGNKQKKKKGEKVESHYMKLHRMQVNVKQKHQSQCLSVWELESILIQSFSHNNV